jgi:hypothetical protein
MLLALALLSLKLLVYTTIEKMEIMMKITMKS